MEIRLNEFWNNQEEIPLRIFYLDRFLEKEKINFEEASSEELNDIFEKIKKDSLELPLEKIKQNIKENNPQDQSWTERYFNKKFEKVLISINNFVIDNRHINYGKRGESHKERLKEISSNEIERKRIDKVKKHYNFLMENLPIFVRNYEEKYEILSGNHRIWAAIENEETEVEVLLLSNPKSI